MRYLAVLAKLDPERKRTFGAVATVSRLSLVHFEKVEAVLAWLEAHEPRVVVFDAGVVHADKLCRKVRSKKNLAGVPIIAIAEEPTDALVERLYGQGADDVVPSALGSVADRAAEIAARAGEPEHRRPTGSRWWLTRTTRAAT